MNHREQPIRDSASAQPTGGLPTRTVAEQQLHDALTAFGAKPARVRPDLVAAIHAAVCEVADEQRERHAGPVALVLAIKRQLADFPASAGIHSEIMRRGIERYYE